ncbi:unnamed protein product [Rotaria sordida]|uniref:Uncharacterized protein n=1 Tax=Rotaria sordida TaxID=392033 RepID=A0A814UT99_9BILA|nr:unnamed protein product [Rotaria sordida]
MSSHFMKTIIGNEFDKVIKELGVGDIVKEEKKDIGISSKDLLADQKRQAVKEKERKERQARRKKEHEEARQKLRDKYDIKNNNEFFIPAHSKTMITLNENQARHVYQAFSVENQGLNSGKTTTNAFQTLKKKCRWK